MHVESFLGVHSWQNGTRCRDGVNVLWCHSHLVWLVFEGSIHTCTCFHSKNRRERLVHTVRACAKNSVILSVKFIMTHKLSLQIVTRRNIR